jgi:hypothetical protein
MHVLNNAEMGAVFGSPRLVRAIGLEDALLALAIVYRLNQESVAKIEKIIGHGESFTLEEPST